MTLARHGQTVPLAAFASDPGMVLVIFGLFGKRERRRASVDTVFARIAEAARRPDLYRVGGIPDSFEGRFEALTLHVFLVLRRLKQLPAPAAEFSQELVDETFAYLELGFRNGGISDIAVPKRMKKIGQSFYGRVKAYEQALDQPGDGELIAALSRNAAPGTGPDALAAYVRAAERHLVSLDLDAILAEERLFPAWSQDNRPQEDASDEDTAHGA